MVKVRINGYETPLTVWHIVELEDGVCNASPDIKQIEQGQTLNHEGNTDFTPAIENPDTWDTNTSLS